MLKNIPKVLSPELLRLIAEMGHGDEIVIGDANFPSHSFGRHTVRADGVSGCEMLDALLTLLPLDSYAKENFILMEVVPGDNVVPVIWDEYKRIAESREKKNLKPGSLERFAFYERCRDAYAVIATGEQSLYANIIIKKGVI